MFDLGPMKMAPHKKVLAVAAGVAALGACLGDSPIQQNGEALCDLDNNLLIASLPPNSIRALTEPTMVAPDDPGVDFLNDSDRILGVYMNGEARAYPHNILWRHEIVNDRIGGDWISVTFCPLTGSGLGFDPVLDGTRLDLGVSGLLFANNLVLYDRLTTGVYGPQLGVEATCQGFSGEALALAPVQEMSWGRWKELHPNTTVVSGDTGEGLNYVTYPYGAYDNLLNPELLFPMSVDATRPIKERVLAIRVLTGGRGYPFGELSDIGDVVAINETLGGVPTAIFYESRAGQSALAFDARVNGQTLTFDADEPNGVWIDQETGSTWRLDGTATAGPLAGERLMTRADAYTLFWFAWRHFQPAGVTYEN